ncbi:50S ribosomal protein L11 methyltransferase [Desulfovibrio ferrophilus]|uniref:Ribosomal protein L11 methyltransferase n=1 Tax=Desulfovibrio ferrophilus TaxID=241368 RepID=A0A2Z6AXV5_9BACT|nr:50S ribosomal protein L11 methyltransferase [Desulfovibrio ferrophilus]BBD08035.1 ribosomal protein L11 methyltransferase [Desulfovibrio ferrophilus]
MKDLLQIKASSPRALIDDVTLYLTENTPHGWQEDRTPDGKVLFTIYLEDTTTAEAIVQGLAAQLPEVSVQRDTVENQEWALAWREFFTPVNAGEVFTVLPPWLADEVPDGRIPILIEPKTAFGTGHHGTTALCLTALANLSSSGVVGNKGTFLDLGTGSGILGLGCCLLGLSGMGLDIDPLAIENAVENKTLNKIGDEFSLSVGSLDTLDLELTFELVLANILAGPLKSMAPALVKRVAPGGSLVLSGILNEQADSVIEKYQAQGLPEPRRESAGEWTALIWERLG